MRATDIPVELNPDILGGKPVIWGMRVPVWLIRVYADEGLDPSEIADFFEGMTTPQVHAALAYARRFTLADLGAPSTF